MVYSIYDKDSCQDEKQNCHNDKNTCQNEKVGKENGKMPLRNHLNQQQMGQLVGTSRQTISQIERGDYSPSVTLALKIAKVCNAKVEDIFQYEEEEEE